MKVKQLKINFFRGIKDLTLDFDLNEPTVFIGINGVGKSTILDCLAILLSWFNVCVQDLHKQGSYFTDSDINNQSKETRNEIKVVTHDLEAFSWFLIKRRKNNLNLVNKSISSNIPNLVSKIYPTYSYLPIAVYYPTQ